MHLHFMTNQPAEAPPAVQRAKNLIEEYFGLPLEDTTFAPFADMKHGGATHGTDVYYCRLMSPTGRTLHDLYLGYRLEDGWVTYQRGPGSVALQVAIDNFVNDPAGRAGTIGEWKPTPEKLADARG